MLIAANKRLLTVVSRTHEAGPRGSREMIWVRWKDLLRYGRVAELRRRRRTIHRCALSEAGLSAYILCRDEDDVLRVRGGLLPVTSALRGAIGRDQKWLLIQKRALRRLGRNALVITH
jgi:hypothetical protein